MECKIRVSRTLIILIYLFSERFIYLLNNDWLPVNCQDIAVVLALLLFLYTVCKVGFHPVKGGRVSYFVILVLFFVLVLTSSFQSNHLYGQSLVMGIMPQRTFISGILLYMSLSQLLRSKFITKEEIIGIICTIAKMEIVISFVQALLGNIVIFMSVQYNFERFGLVRLYLVTTFVAFLYFKSLSEVLEEFNWKSLRWAVLSAIFFMFISQSRLELIGLLIASAVMILVLRRSASIKIGYIVIASILVAVLLSTNYAQTIIDSIITQTADTDDIRTVGKELMVRNILKNPLLGCGYVNTNNANALSSLYAYNEYGGIRKVGLNDNGIYSFTYLYGFLGLAWLAVLFFKFLRDALVIARKQNSYGYLGIWVFFVVVSPNIAAWFFNQLGVYLLMTVLALAEHEIASYVVEYEVGSDYDLISNEGVQRY